MFWRNLFAVLIGLTVAFIIITIGITINKSLFFPEMNEEITSWKVVYTHWRKVNNQAHFTFYLALLISLGLGSLFGGVVAAFFVKRAKVAYALFIGFLLGIADWINIIFFPQPIWYILASTIVLYLFAWIGGKFVESSIGRV